MSLAGDVICSGVPLPRPVNVADRGYFRGALATRQFTVGEYAIGRASGKASLLVAHPVMVQEGTVARVIPAGIDLAWLNRLAAAVPLPGEAVLNITDASGIILARHPDPERWVGKSAAELPAFKALRTRPGESVAEAAGIDGVLRLYAVSPLAAARGAEAIHVGVGIPRAVAFAEADRLLRRNLIWFAVGVALVLALAWVGSDVLLLRPARRLLRATRRAATGDLTARSGPPYAGGEVGELERAFDDMVASLEQRQAQARALAEAGRALMGPLDLRGVADQIATSALGVLAGRRAAVYAVDEAEPERLVCVGGAGDLPAVEWMGYAIPLGRSLTGFAAAERRPTTSANTRDDPRFQPGPWARAQTADDQCHAWASVPLIVGGELVGAMSVGDTTGRHFTAEEVGLLAGFGSSAALALRNARLLARTERRRAEAEALTSAARDLTERLDVQAVAERVVGGIQTLLGCPGARLRLLTPEGGLVGVAFTGPIGGQFETGNVIPPGQGLTQRAIREGRTLQTPDLLTEPGLVLPEDVKQRYTDSAHRALLSVPLRAAGTLIGALNLSQATGWLFSADEVRLAEAFADQAALALHNARLYEEAERRRHQAEEATEAARQAGEGLRRHAERLRILHAIDQGILAARTPRDIAQAALERVGELLPCIRAGLTVFDYATLEAVILAVHVRSGVTALGEGARFPIGEGNLEWLRAGQVQVVEDILSLSHLERMPILHAEGVRSFMFVPLLAQGELMGALTLGAEAAGVFQPEHVEIAREVAAQLAVALRQARLMEEAEGRRVEAEAAAAEARRAAEALRESEASLDQAQERARLGSWEFDLKAGGARWSREMFRLYERESTLGEPGLAEFLEYVHPDDRGMMSRRWTETLRTGEPTTLDYRTNPGRGPVHHFNTTIHRVTGAGGEPVSLLGTVLDVTERVRAEQEVRALNEQLEERVRQRTAQLEEVNAEMEAFAYTVAHDLRAPLRAMQGLSQALLEDYGARLDATGLEYAGRVVRAAESMDELIRDLLAYGRLSRTEIRLEPVRWASVVDGARNQLEAELGGAEVEARVPESLPEVAAHRATLAQVVVNLLGNAVKFVAPGVTPRVRVWAEERGERMRLWVEDNGIGIAPEHHERIFRVFERLHGRESYPGTGIGLAIVRKGMERMGGGCGVESAPGQGSRFWVDLPRA